MVGNLALATQKASHMHGNRHAASRTKQKSGGFASNVRSWGAQAQTDAGIGCRCKSRPAVSPLPKTLQISDCWPELQRGWMSINSPWEVCIVAPCKNKTMFTV